MQQVDLTIQQTRDGTIWGQIYFGGQLFTESAKSVESLENNFKYLLWTLHKVDPKSIQFDLAYDLTAMFAANTVINHPVNDSSEKSPLEVIVKKIQTAGDIAGKFLRNVIHF